MPITPETVQHVANLARLAIPPAEVAGYAEQLSRILALMEQLGRIPTDGVAPMSHAVDMVLREREDGVTNTDQRQAMLSNAPDQEEGCFRVPKVIE